MLPEVIILMRIGKSALVLMSAISPAWEYASVDAPANSTTTSPREKKPDNGASTTVGGAVLLNVTWEKSFRWTLNSSVFWILLRFKSAESARRSAASRVAAADATAGMRFILAMRGAAIAPTDTEVARLVYVNSFLLNTNYLVLFLSSFSLFLMF
jgi:hypothetical protein